MPERTHLGLARTDEANLEHPNATTDYSSRTDSSRPRMKTTAFWGALGWPCLRVQVVDQTTPPLSWNSFVGTSIQNRPVLPAHTERHVQPFTHTHTPIPAKNILGCRKGSYIKPSYDFAQFHDLDLDSECIDLCLLGEPCGIKYHCRTSSTNARQPSFKTKLKRPSW